MKYLVTLTMMLTLCATQAEAQSSRERRDATVAKLLARVDALENELRALRKQDAPVREESSKPSSLLSQSVIGPEGEQSSFPQLKLRGFGDVEYRWADGGENRNAFRIGGLDLFLTSQLSENLSVLSESVIEADDSDRFGFEIERFLLQYNPREYLNVAVGRYHTAIGYYSTAYHHGKWLQTAAARPKIFQFEDDGGLLPIHNVGLSVSGAIPSGRLGLRYVVEVGGGRKYEPGEEGVQNLSDNNAFKAVNLALSVRPDWMPGWQAGGSVYFDKLNSSVVSGTVDQTIVSAHAVYLTPTVEWLTEGVLMRHASDEGSFNSFGAYSQFSRRFGQFRPYVRYEYNYKNERDPIVLATVEPGREQILALGVRYDFTELAALKLQWERALIGNIEGARNEALLQLSFTF